MRGRRSLPPIVPRKAPRQERSRAMVEWILEAATRILAADGLAGLNTNRVATVAGISVGSLYQYFPNKEAIVTALIARAQHEVAEAIEAVAAAVREAPLEDAIGALVDLALAAQYERGTLAVALDHEERRLPVDRMVAPLHARMRAALAGLLQPHLPQLDASALEEVAEDLFVVVRSLVDHAGATSIPRDRMRPRLIRAAIGYVHACRGA